MVLEHSSRYKKKEKPDPLFLKREEALRRIREALLGRASAEEHFRRENNIDEALMEMEIALEVAAMMKELQENLHKVKSPERKEPGIKEVKDIKAYEADRDAKVRGYLV